MKGSPLNKDLSYQNHEVYRIWSHRTGQLTRCILSSSLLKWASLTPSPAEAQRVRAACRRLPCSSHSLGANPAACTSIWEEGEKGGILLLGSGSSIQLIPQPSHILLAIFSPPPPFSWAKEFLTSCLPIALPLGAAFCLCGCPTPSSSHSLWKAGVFN